MPRKVTYTSIKNGVCVYMPIKESYVRVDGCMYVDTRLSILMFLVCCDSALYFQAAAFSQETGAQARHETCSDWAALVFAEPPTPNQGGTALKHIFHREKNLAFLPFSQLIVLDPPLAQESQQIV